ncbi:hypothetical protein PGT21_030135 [Puccinia graminis f. sp. tritici]|uniref:Uncharacterized protein n=1 Tax=Puccinia graminis f. sp. tritici TaxID=56615 RepID=A0A5B0M0R1_PUCGR|nr:hypothetical protein PGT21_030135 [Puccinia graminis f. sp. tritici]
MEWNIEAVKFALRVQSLLEINSSSISTNSRLLVQVRLLLHFNSARVRSVFGFDAYSSSAAI